MKKTLLILALFISTSAQAATVAPPDTTQQQATYLPNARDFGDLNFRTDTPTCGRTEEQRRKAAVRGWVVAGILVATVLFLFYTAASSKRAAQK